MEPIDKNLLQLIENMSGIHDGNEPIGSQTLSWNAYQIAREINDLSIVPQTMQFIESSDNGKLKKHAYQLLLFILSNTKDNELADTLLLELKKEDANEDTLYTLLIGLWESKTGLENHLDDVLFYIDDQRSLIRNAAIRVVSLYKKNHADAEDALIDIIKNPYDNYDLRYAVETLAVIGSKKSITALQEAKKETEDYETQELISKTINKLK